MFDRTPQEDLLVVEALVQYEENHREDWPARAGRAWNLAEEIAAVHGLTVEDALKQQRQLKTNAERAECYSEWL